MSCPGAPSPACSWRQTRTAPGQEKRQPDSRLHCFVRKVRCGGRTVSLVRPSCRPFGVEHLTLLYEYSTQDTGGLVNAHQSQAKLSRHRAPAGCPWPELMGLLGYHPIALPWLRRSTSCWCFAHFDGSGKRLLHLNQICSPRQVTPGHHFKNKTQDSKTVERPRE